MASVYLLMHDIRNSLLESFEHLPFREPVNRGQPFTPDGEKRYRVPRVYLGATPPKRKSGADPATGAESGEDYPALVIQCLDGETNSQTPGYAVIDTATINVRCLAYNPDSAEEGVRDVMDMIERAKLVLADRDTWADDMWRRDLPVKWVCGLDKRIDLFDAGFHFAPFYGGSVETRFTAAGVMKRLDPKIFDAM